MIDEDDDDTGQLAEQLVDTEGAAKPSHTGHVGQPGARNGRLGQAIAT